MSEATRSAGSASAVTPSDTENLAYGCRGLYIGGTGDVAVVFAASPTPVVFKAAPAGTTLPVQPLRVNDTETTATDIVAMF
jgi:hypothetical protein